MSPIRRRLVNGAIPSESGQGHLGLERRRVLLALAFHSFPPFLGHQSSLAGGPVFGVHYRLARLPHPFSAADRAAGYRYDVSTLQAEFSLTQVLDRPLSGRIFFEEVIRENLDLGRPDKVQLIFNRRVSKRTPGRFRTRVLTDGVTPSLYVDYKKSRIKQYHKEGRAL